MPNASIRSKCAVSSGSRNSKQLHIPARQQVVSPDVTASVSRSNWNGLDDCAETGRRATAAMRRASLLSYRERCPCVGECFGLVRETFLLARVSREYAYSSAW